MRDVNRREFLVAATLTVAGVAVCGCGATAAWGRDVEPTGPFDAGPLADYLADGVVDRFAKPEKFFLVTENGRLFAPSAMCTHRNCTVKVHGDHYECPCHGSDFTREGKLIGGRAKRSLAHYGIHIDDKQHVIIERSKHFVEKQWDEPGSYVTLKKKAQT
jgi:nitrite reductase/ring-hydroxylating ferredoxin subunit